MMIRRVLPLAFVAILPVVHPLEAQTARSQPAIPTTARVDASPLTLIEPDRFYTPVVFEPIRRVTVMATDDGIVQAVSVKPGDSVRERQELIALDRSEALARLRIAQAEVKERQAALSSVARATPAETIAHAQLEAAQARAELAQLLVDRCTLRAPFAGRVLAVGVSPGQYVAKGSVVAELADVSTLRALVPVERDRVQPGSTINLETEGRTVPARVQGVLPLPESLAALRVLAASWSGAWVLVENPPQAGLEPGQRVTSPFVPTAPVTVVPSPAVQNPDASGAGTGPFVQIIRNEHVATIPVRVLGTLGADHTQISGAFRNGDAAIVSSSVALAEGTFIRFLGPTAAANPVETVPTPPDAVGSVANINTPAPGRPAPVTRTAPIGSPDRPAPRTAPAPTPTRPAPTQPATGGSVPF